MQYFPADSFLEWSQTFSMLIEQDRSKPIAHVVKLFVLIKKKQMQMLSL